MRLYGAINATQTAVGLFLAKVGLGVRWQKNFRQGLTSGVTFVIITHVMNKFTQIGNEMMEYAEQADFTAQRGLIDELFPFIYMASKRMSLRAITRWLEENHRIQISVNAVAKAMRNQEEFWARLVEDVEPSARIMADAYNVEPSEVLDSRDVFQHLEVKTPAVAAEDAEGIETELRQHRGCGRRDP
jgi:hypothetical protein